MTRSNSVKQLSIAAMIAALYTALTLCLSPIAFGPAQCRVAEALTVLAAVTPAAVPGLAVGCALSNLAGLGLGANILGLGDVFVGTLATLLAALLSRALRHARLFGLPVLSTLPPVVLNALAIGGELTLASPVPTVEIFFVQAGLVALGQSLACIVGGLLLYTAIRTTGLADKLR